MVWNRLRGRLLGTVPVSIALHLVAVVSLLIVPLLAKVSAPPPNEVSIGFVRAAPFPRPPEIRLLSHPARTPILMTQHSQTAAATGPGTFAGVPARGDVAVPDLGPRVSSGDATAIGVTVHTAAPPSRSPARQSEPVRAAELPIAPVKIAGAEPTYPDIARTAHVEGTVILECVIDTTGRVTNLRVLNSVPLLDQAAVEAVRQWRYRPSVYSGRRVSVLMTVTVRFVLK